jgi:hypothetical protein
MRYWLQASSNQSTTGGSITNQMDAKEIAPGLKSVTTVEGKGDGIKNGELIIETKKNKTRKASSVVSRTKMPLA